MTTLNVLINGAFGRMGQIAVNAIKNHPRLNLVGEISREYDLKKSIIDSKANIVIDFTNAHSVYENTKIIIETGAHPVIGTSGLTKEQITALQTECTKLKLGGLIAPNFSLGAVLMMKYAKAIAAYMPHVEIIEMHHNKKLDSPSGTAIRTAEMIADTINSTAHAKHEQTETVTGARGANYRNIPIHAIRLPGLLAHQKVIFGNTGETLTLQHDSVDRACFMPGICLACEKVVGLDKLIYGLEEILV